jgi:hypothetical protein
MNTGRDKNSCLFGEELVSYIYDELPAGGRTAFEDHLLSCTNCVEAFAAVSEARLGVYEWHRDEFLPLETPAFEIPYERPVIVSEPEFSWLDALRGIFTPARLAAAGGAFAVLAFAFGTFFILTSPSEPLVADANDTVRPAVVSDLPETKISRPEGGTQMTLVESPVSETKAERINAKAAQNASRSIQSRASNKHVIRKDQDQTQATRSTSVPRLGTYDEPEDNSLRLADLVADIDTKDF